MQEFLFWYDVPADPNVRLSGPASHRAWSKCMLDPIQDLCAHPLYVNSTLSADICNLFRPTIGFEVYKTNGEFGGILVKAERDPPGRLNIPYRCCQRIAAKNFTRRRDLLRQSRPWIVVVHDLTVMRGEATRGLALRDAFVNFAAIIPKHDPGPPPEGEDLAALEGLY